MGGWNAKVGTKLTQCQARTRARESGMRRSEVISPDGLKLAAYEAGNGAGAEILFIHGFSQCAECWEPQFYDRS